MKRSLAMLVVGALAGSALAFAYSHRSAPRVSSAPVAELPGEPSSLAPRLPASPPADRPAGGSGLATERLAHFERAAAIADASTLEDLIVAAAARPRSVERELELEALLARLADLDSEAMAELGEALYLDSELLAPVYRDWGQTDASAALAALARISTAPRRQALALAVLAALGDDDATVARVAAALPDSERFGLERSALVAHAVRDPERGLDALRERGGRTQRLLRLAVADALARSDPRAAIEHARFIPDEFNRSEFVSRVCEVWAEQSLDDVLAFLGTPEGRAFDTDSRITRAVAQRAPERMLAALDSTPGIAAYEVRYAALRALAERDAFGALEYIRRLPSAGDQTGLMIAVAEAYGRQSPDAALAWAESLSPPLPAARDAVVQGIGETDFDRAVDLLLQAQAANGPGRPGSTMPSFMSRVVTSGSDAAPRLLDRLLAAPSAARWLEQGLSWWRQSNPEAAMAWVAANGARLDAQVLSALAADFAQEDVEGAIRALDIFPADRRGGWLAGIASGLGRSDPDRALEIVERYRGQPGYAEGLNAVLRGQGNTDPMRAARLLVESGQAVSGETMMLVAGNWVQLDPHAASAWAVGLRDERLRGSAMRAVTFMRTQDDPTAARAWLLELPRGSARDAGLDAMLLASRARPSVSLDAGLLDAYSSDGARQRAFVPLVQLLARRNPDEAKRLIDTHITDPAIRRDAEQALAQPPRSNEDVLMDFLGMDAPR